MSFSEVVEACYLCCARPHLLHHFIRQWHNLYNFCLLQADITTQNVSEADNLWFRFHCLLTAEMMEHISMDRVWMELCRKCVRSYQRSIRLMPIFQYGMMLNVTSYPSLVNCGLSGFYSIKSNQRRNIVVLPSGSNSSCPSLQQVEYGNYP